ncbi:outer membrane beta-barrel protein [Fulvivirgaceae bacterium BMA10]|uniref:Outer membrane beta-barrel protein n=1 Tax=Splendidivirga corallicola TaxID=3051826 RepID=A0ABT8KNR2_9BACT|nr:outer membrane beta-barrel protein [Fulvivirgaceae bacterium BMA10]
MHKRVFIVVFCFLSNWTLAQEHILSGSLLDQEDRSPLSGANVILTNLQDSTKRYLTVADLEGKFRFIAPDPGNYLLKVSYVGYQKLERNIQYDGTSQDLGEIAVAVESALLNEVVVEEKVPPVILKGDTTQFNARAYKTNPDASAEDLISKMPGVVIENGTVKAQGEDVQKVLVDGRTFFGDDPTLALRNLPAEVIDRIEVFDKLSDQAQFTGFDDGQSVKTINIVTRPDMRNGQFGKLFAGYGTDERYSAGGNVNFFNNDQRISLIGHANNINKQNFSTQDLLGIVGNTRRGRGRGGFGAGLRGRGGRGGGRPGGSFNRGGDVSNFLVGQQNGITETQSFGLNFNDVWGEKLTINGSYFFNASDNLRNELLSREYFLEGDANQLYEEQSLDNSNNYNHRVNARFEYTIDRSNSLIIVPKLNFQSFKALSGLSGTNSLITNELLNRSTNDYQINTSGYNIGNSLLFRHRFGKRGRTISVNVNTNWNNKNADSDLDALSEFFQGPTSEVDSVDQVSDENTYGYAYSTNIAYTEPIGQNAQLQLNYNGSFSRNFSEKRTFNFDMDVQEHALLDTALSNDFDNDYFTHRGGLSYRYRKGRSMFWVVGASYQSAELINDQTFPETASLGKTFSSFLPNAMLRYEFSKKSNLRVFYRTMTNAPSISQLQNVVNNTNPLLLSTGNPDLKQEYSNLLISRFSLNNVEKSKSFFALLYLRNTSNYIANSTLIAQQDTVLADGTVLNQGTQLNLPVNLDGYWNARSFVTFGLPVAPLKSNLNLNSGFTYTRAPGMVNDGLNISNTYNLNQGVVLSSNISEKLDFTLSYTANYNIVRNSLEPALDNNYFFQTTGLKFNWIFWKGVVFRNELSHQLYRGLTDEFNQEFLLWSVSIGKKLFKNENGDIRLTVFDLLDQNNSITRNTTETYIEDQETQVLNQYFMLTFTYTLRKFRQG